MCYLHIIQRKWHTGTCAPLLHIRQVVLDLNVQVRQGRSSLPQLAELSRNVVGSCTTSWNLNLFLELVLLVVVLCARLEALADSLDHLAEPVKVERVEHNVASQVDGRHPERQRASFLGVHHDVLSTGQLLVGRRNGHVLSVRGSEEGVINVIPNHGGLADAPDQTGREEGEEQDDAIVELDLSSGQTQLVAEPMNVEEGGRQLVEDEDGGIVVQEGSLYVKHSRNGSSVKMYSFAAKFGSQVQTHVSKRVDRKRADGVS